MAAGDPSGRAAGFQLPVELVYIETAIPPGMTIAEYRATHSSRLPRAGRFRARLQEYLGRYATPRRADTSDSRRGAGATE